MFAARRIQPTRLRGPAQAAACSESLAAHAGLWIRADTGRYGFRPTRRPHTLLNDSPKRPRRNNLVNFKVVGTLRVP